MAFNLRLGIYPAICDSQLGQLTPRRTFGGIQRHSFSLSQLRQEWSLCLQHGECMPRMLLNS